MCTSMSIASKNNNYFFGRTMDFSYELDPEVYIVPRGYEWNNALNNYKIKNKYKFIGTGQNIGKVTFADGANEMGLGVAVLYFQGYASFENKVNKNYERVPIAAIEMVQFLLGNCSDVESVINTVGTIEIIGVRDAITNSIAPLHWIVADKMGRCITIEQTQKGLEIFYNPIRVLSNSPNFEWHMTNLKNYFNLSPEQNSVSKWDDLILKPFGQGAGTWSLPGDYTAPSRFVRVAFQKSFAKIPETEDKTVNLCFNIMKNVTIPKGVVVTERNTDDYTQYTVFMNLNTGDYYFNTHDNNQILKANINDIDTNEVISLGKLKRPAYFEHI